MPAGYQPTGQLNIFQKNGPSGNTNITVVCIDNCFLAS